MKKIILSSILIVISAITIFPQNSQNILYISILHTNDIHGNIEISKAEYINPEFPPLTGNLASIKTIIKNFKTYINADTYILLDAGDFFQGTPIANLSKGEAVIDIFNKVGYDAIAIGNHDFDLGFENLKLLAAKSAAQFICCNIVSETDGMPLELFKSYIIKEVNGIRIGIIGVITDEMQRLSVKQNIEGLKFLNSATEVSRTVELLRNKENCNIIIVVSHIGFESDKILAKNVNGIDVIVGGHSHTGLQEIYEDPENHTLITQAYSKGGTLGNLILKIDLSKKIIIGFKQELITLFSDLYPPDKTITEAIKIWKEKVESGFDEIIGYAKNNLLKSEQESNLGNLICDALVERYNADVAFQNSGGIRAELKKGDIKIRDVFNVLPFDNDVIILKMSGAELLEALETSVEGSHGILQVSGIEMVYNPKLPAFKRVISAKVKNQPIDKEKIYTVVTNSYITESEGTAYAVFKQAKYIEDTFDILRDVVIDYIKNKKNISAEIESRIKIKQ